MLFNLFNVTNRTYFMISFKQRLRDQYIQQWFISVSTRSSCSLYKNITNNFWCQNHFHMVTNCNHKISNQKSLTTKCNSGQREKSQILQRTACPTCKVLGDAFHCLFECGASGASITLNTGCSARVFYVWAPYYTKYRVHCSYELCIIHLAQDALLV